eukprot:SAG31_NODE_64_length_28590_cov_17.914464_17_plen_108_part_00
MSSPVTMSFGSGGVSFGSTGLESLPGYGSMDLLADIDHEFDSDLGSDGSDGQDDENLPSPHIAIDGLQLQEVCSDLLPPIHPDTTSAALTSRADGPGYVRRPADGQR